MLASLLPGLREIRAPLAAGYLWLVVGWLLLHDRIDRGASAPGAVDGLTELRDAIGVGGITAAASFLAYLLGALWDPTATRAAEVLWAVRTKLRSAFVRLAWLSMVWLRARKEGREMEWTFDSSVDRRIESGFDPGSPPPSYRISVSGWGRLWLAGQRFFSEVDEVLPTNVQLVGVPNRFAQFLSEYLSAVRVMFDESDVRNAAALVKGSGARVKGKGAGALARANSALEAAAFTSTYDEWWLGEARDVARELRPYEMHDRFLVGGHRDRSDEIAIHALTKATGSSAVSLLSEAEVTARLFEELPLTARRLVGEQQELFLEADRMRGEVEFRYALAIPVSIAVAVLAFGMRLPVLLWLAVAVGGLLAGWALLEDGWRRDAQRNDLLVELLSIGRGKSPTFERLRERADRFTASGEHGELRPR